VQIDTDCHEIIPNGPLSERITQNLKAIGPPEFNDEEELFARRLQDPLVKEFGTTFPEAFKREVLPYPRAADTSKGSTDVGDISWRVATGGVRTTCFAAGSPGHSWQNVACIGSTIGEKGILYAAKTLAVTAIDLLEEPDLVEAAKADWQERTKDREYFSFIPEGQAPPAKIR
jgi:aminobenzoyl-glutamate utilization protein B